MEAEAEVRPGDFLVTRNTDAVGNESPGYWNHCAIVIDGNWIVESMESLNGVIAVPIWNFFNRYPEVLVLRPIGIDGEAISKMISKAKDLIGRPYDKYGSVGVTWRHRKGDNCVSVVRRAYINAFNSDPSWTTPDSLVRTFTILQPIAHKKDYENHKDPEAVDRFKGAIKVVPNTPAQALAN